MNKMENQYPTIVSFFYNIRKKENIPLSCNRQIDKYLELASQFILTLPYPLIIFTDDDYVANFIETERLKYNFMHITMIYCYPLEETYFYSHIPKLYELQKKFHIINGDLNHETPLYIILNNNKFYFMEEAIRRNPFSSSHFIWMDFGINHVAKHTEKIHEWIHSVPDKIKQLCINPYLEKDNPKDFFQYIYHHTAGGLFSGSAENILLYSKLFKQKINEIYANDWYQIDEAIMTMVQRENPDLFDLFYGDYQGIICNYMEPIVNIHLINTMYNKILQFQDMKRLYHISVFMEKYFIQHLDTFTDFSFLKTFLYGSFLSNYDYHQKHIRTNILIILHKLFYEKKNKSIQQFIKEKYSQLIKRYSNHSKLIL
jgi:hypothetical protein